MAKLWQPQEPSIYQYWIDTILEESEDKLSDWERNFIDSLQKRLQLFNLTQRQAEVLEKIYAEKTT